MVHYALDAGVLLDLLYRLLVLHVPQFRVLRTGVGGVRATQELLVLASCVFRTKRDFQALHRLRVALAKGNSNFWCGG